MKTLIIYCTTHGCTERISKKLKSYLGGDITLIDLKKEPIPSLKLYKQIIIGGSIHAGQIQKRIKNFCINNKEELQSKELGLFICCMKEGIIAQEQLRNSYPEELLQKAKATAILGGEFNFDRMNFFEKLIVKKVAGVDKNISKIDTEAIIKFSRRMDRIFNPFLFIA